MEVVAHSPTMDSFDFSGTRSSPYLSAPSSPKRFGEYNYLSAPTSPSRLSEFYREFDYFSSTISMANDSASSSKEVTNNMDEIDGDEEDGFAFFVSRESDKSSRSAEELFDGGKIKPLRPPTMLDLEGNTDELFPSPKTPLLSPRQPKTNRSPVAEGKKMIRQAFSPKNKRESQSGDPSRRGRDRTPAAVVSSSNSGRRVTRSYSPCRISHYVAWDEEQQRYPHQQPKSTKEEYSTSSSRASLSSTSSPSKSSRKWRLRDFLLFRSASEGRGSSKDPFKKYSVLYNKKPEEGKASSFRSSSSDKPPSAAPGSRRKGQVSAHELHYAMKKAESEDLKKKTFLPYKRGILGRLAGLGSLTR